MSYIEEEKRKTEVVMDCDVLVAGGGIAGISAALAAARTGARVVLCEKQVLLGGLATLGLITIYLPLCDGNAHQIVYGIGEELFRLSIKNGVEDREPTAWLNGGTDEEKKAKRFEVEYNPHLFEVEAEQLLIKEGVEILYDTKICDVQATDGKIKAVIVENKSGRSAITVKSVVDATGDADVCKLSGAKTALYGPKNIVASWHYYINNTGLNLRMFGATDRPNLVKDANDKRKGADKLNTDFKYSGVDAVELSKALQMAHKAFLDDVISHRETHPEHTPVTLPTVPQVRMTRRIVGEYDIDVADDHKSFEDSIGMISNWRKAGPVFEVPFRSLHGKEIKNLAVAGRCISSTDDMWDITRVIPPCAVTGEAAGTAAAMTDDFTTLDVSQLQKKLKANNVKLHLDEVL